MATMGGITAKEVTERIMSSIYSCALAIQFNWMGKGDKSSIKDLQLCKAVKGTILF